LRVLSHVSPHSFKRALYLFSVKIDKAPHLSWGGQKGLTFLLF
jgi:hypothetical protein